MFHNLKGYDAHHLMQAMSKVEGAGELSCIAKNMEKYISFSLGNLHFIDSNAFLLASLDALVKATPKEALKITKRLCPKAEKLDLLCKKGIYLYEYMDSWERFNETKLPAKERFFSNLSGEHISDGDYHHAQEVWETFKSMTSPKRSPVLNFVKFMCCVLFIFFMKKRLTSSQMALPSMPLLYSRLGEPLTVTLTFFMSGSKNFSESLVPEV